VVTSGVELPKKASDVGGVWELSCERSRVLQLGVNSCKKLIALNEAAKECVDQ
jgi:hypothetical protein